MRFATSRRQPASLYVHGNTTWQHSCSHSNAICNPELNNCIELRTYNAPVIAEHRGGTNRAWNPPSRNRRTHEVPFIAGRSHFTRKKHKVSCLATSQNKAPATSMLPLQCVLQSAVTNPHLFTHIATQHGNMYAAIPMRSATLTSTTA